MNPITTLREADKIAKDTAISAQHTQGQLKANKTELMLEAGRFRMASRITACGSSAGLSDEIAVAQANARRLAACWNVCQGATTEQLERSKDLTSFVLAAQEIERQKTALLNAVMRLAGRGFFDVSPMTQSEALEDLEMMWEAIAKATAT